MAISGLSVVGLPAVKNEPVMLKSSRNSSRNRTQTQKRVAVIKNAHTAAELDEIGERWATHSGPYLTVAETIAMEAAKNQTAQ